VSFPDFAWSSGEEASDPLVLHDGALVRVDELARSGHLAQQERDLAAIAALGVRVWRYGMPWRLVERSPGEYDWSLWDRALAACERNGLEPVVDLCHFGLPDHYTGFCQPDWVEGFVRYVEAFLARYRAPRWFTPVNEPSFTALGSARYGIWNDRRRSPEDFALALCHVVLANLEANARIRTDRDGWWVGAEGFSCPVACTDAHAAEAERLRASAWAVWDLHFGKALAPELEPDFAAVPRDIRLRIEKLATTANTIAGHDFYPVSIVPVGGTLEG
jgi:beta-glucosidase/6-phospho-beta-glucosidase/beta-galactosidase